MEILDYYRNHCDKVKNKIECKTTDEITDLILTVSKFYFIFSFVSIIEKHIFININQTEFFKGLKTDNLSFYRDANQKSLDRVNVYDPDYEEIDELELQILNGFSSMLNQNKKKSLFDLFDGIITILDYYEQFSDRPEYWNRILEKELNLQMRLLDLEKNDLGYYSKHYESIKFEEL